jgi:type 1 fimbria pilin
MSASRTLLYSCFLLLLGSVSTVAVAGSGGIIHFEGMIVEPPCEVNINAKYAVMACDRQGHVETKTVSLNTLATKASGVMNIASMKMDYLNPAHTLAVIDIIYN